MTLNNITVTLNTALRNYLFELMQIRDEEKAYLFTEADSALGRYTTIKILFNANSALCSSDNRPKHFKLS